MLISLGFVEIRIAISVDKGRNAIRKAVQAELRRGRVYAIKKHRELTGSSLKEAYDYVMGLMPASTTGQATASDDAQ
jgi:ribosomal protein L7/L12